MAGRFAGCESASSHSCEAGVSPVRNLGDCKVIGSGIREMRIHTGPGYRVYFVQKKQVILLLLCGGSKASQARDIARAKKIAQELKDNDNG